MNGIKRFFTEVKAHKKYMVPVMLFTITSLMYLLTHFNILWASFALIFQIIFFIWIIIVALLNRFKFWPILIFGLIFFSIGLSMVDVSSDLLNEAKEAYYSNDLVTAKNKLEAIDSQEILNSDDYITISENINDKIYEEKKNLIKKTKDAINKNDLESANENIEKVLQYDITDSEAQELKSKIIILQKKEQEKIIADENKQKIKKLEQHIDVLIKKHNFQEAKTVVENFSENNNEIDSESLIIKSISKKINDSEKQFEIDKKKNLIKSKYKEALKFYQKKQYQKSLSNIEDILKIDETHKEAKKLLARTNKKIEIENEKFWDNVKGIGVLILVILMGIGYMTNQPENNDAKEQNTTSNKNTNNKSFISELISDHKYTCQVTYKYRAKGNFTTRSGGYRTYKSESAVIEAIRKQNPEYKDITIISLKWKD